MKFYTLPLPQERFYCEWSCTDCTKTKPEIRHGNNYFTKSFQSFLIFLCYNDIGSKTLTGKEHLWIISYFF